MAVAEETDDDVAWSNLVPFHDDYPLIVEGQVYKYRRWGLPGTKGHYQRIIMPCPLNNSTHKHDLACEKRHNTGKASEVPFGRLQPLAFLGAWIRAGAGISDL